MTSGSTCLLFVRQFHFSYFPAMLHSMSRCISYLLCLCPICCCLVQVVLVGEGADEILGGYSRFKDLPVQRFDEERQLAV